MSWRISSAQPGVSAIRYKSGADTQMDLSTPHVTRPPSRTDPVIVAPAAALGVSGGKDDAALDPIADHLDPVAGVAVDPIDRAAQADARLQIAARLGRAS